MIEKEEYENWLKSGTSIYSAKCCQCVKERNVEYGCVAALKSHVVGQAHRDIMKAFENAQKGLSALFFNTVAPLARSTSTAKFSS